MIYLRLVFPAHAMSSAHLRKAIYQMPLAGVKLTVLLRGAEMHEERFDFIFVEVESHVLEVEAFGRS